MDNKVKYGLSNVYYAKGTIADNGDITYDKPVHIPGAVNISLDAEGELSPWYADDVVYTILNNNNGYSGDLEIALIPEDFAVDILHENYDMFYAMVESADYTVEHFALMFQFEGDKHAIRHVLYNCICDRPSIESATTEDTKEPQTDVLHLTVMPRADGIIKARTSSETPDDIFDGWFDEVYVPDTIQPEPTTYTVRFWNGDVLLQTVTVQEGETAIYTGSTPVSPDNPDLVFLGWNPEPVNVKSDMDCYAVYEMQTYTVYFYNGDTLLQTVTGVWYGGSATYTGETPVSSDGDGYVFTGWEPEPVNITADTKCYAQFALKTLTVEFYNGTTLLQTVTVDYGGTAVYTGSTPVSPDNPDADFTGWDPEPVNVTSDMKCYAQYNTNTYTVWFYNGDVLLQTISDVAYGASVVYDGDTPENANEPERAFIGWDPEPTNITKNTACYAQYSTGAAIAVFSEDDNSLTFYVDEKPSVGSKYNGKTVTYVYTRFCNITSPNGSPWLARLDTIESIYVDSSFSIATPVCTRYWFCGLTACKSIDVHNLNTSIVTNMERTFYESSLAETINVTGLDTSNVTNMYYLFYGCKSVKELDVDDFVVDNVTNMACAFGECESIESFDFSKWNTSKVENFGSFLYDCINLKSLKLGNFDTSNCSRFVSMFGSCTSLPEIDLSSFDTSNGTTFQSMFVYCDSLTEINISNFDMHNVTSTSGTYGMFQRCTNLKTIYADDDKLSLGVSSETDLMFAYDENLVGGNGTVYNSEKRGSTMAHVDTASNPGYFTDKDSPPYSQPVADSNGEIYDSWEDIIKNIDNGNDKYSVGQHKPLDLGDEGTVDMQIVSKGTDTLADGSGYATYTWLSEQLLTTAKEMNPWEWGDNGDGSNDDGSFNDGTGGIGGWEKCELRSYMKSSIWSLIPSEVRSGIKTVTKTQTAYDTNGNSFTQSTDDDIWIPSSNEMNTSSGMYKELYPDNSSRAKNIVGTDESDWWWLRNSGGHSNYYAVTATGGTGNRTSTSESYICLGFCT